MGDNGQPWSSPIGMLKGSDWKSLKERIVLCVSSLLWYQSVYCLGMPLFLMLCMSVSTTMLGKAALTSKKIIDIYLSLGPCVMCELC